MINFEYKDFYSFLTEEEATVKKPKNPRQPPNSTQIPHTTLDGERWNFVYPNSALTTKHTWKGSVKVPKQKGVGYIGFINSKTGEYLSLSQWNARKNSSDPDKKQAKNAAPSQDMIDSAEKDVLPTDHDEEDFDTQDPEEDIHPATNVNLFKLNIDVNNEAQLKAALDKQTDAQLYNLLKFKKNDPFSNYSAKTQKTIKSAITDISNVFANHNYGQNNNDIEVQSKAFSLLKDTVAKYDLTLTAAGNVKIGVLADDDSKGSVKAASIFQLNKQGVGGQLFTLIRQYEKSQQDPDDDNTFRVLYSDHPKYLLTPSYLFADGALGKRLAKPTPSGGISIGDATYDKVDSFSPDQLYKAVKNSMPLQRGEDSVEHEIKLRREYKRIERYVNVYNDKIDKIKDLFTTHNMASVDAFKGNSPTEKIVNKISDGLDFAIKNTGRKVDEELLSTFKKKLYELSYMKFPADVPYTEEYEGLSEKDAYNKLFSREWGKIYKLLSQEPEQEESKEHVRLATLIPSLAESIAAMRHAALGRRVFFPLSTIAGTIDFVSLAEPYPPLNVKTADELVSRMQLVTTQLSDEIYASSVKGGTAGVGAGSSTQEKLKYSKFKSRKRKLPNGQEVLLYDDETVKNDITNLCNIKKTIFSNSPNSVIETNQLMDEIITRYKAEIGEFFRIPYALRGDTAKIVTAVLSTGTNPLPPDKLGGLPKRNDDAKFMQAINKPDVKKKFQAYSMVAYLIPAIYNGTLDYQMISNESFSTNGISVSDGVHSMAYLQSRLFKNTPEEDSEGNLKVKGTVPTDFKNAKAGMYDFWSLREREAEPRKRGRPRKDS